MLTAEQRAERRTGLGGTDLAAILGYSSHRTAMTTAMDVYLEKVGLAAESEDNRPARLGRLLEDAVAENYAIEEGVKLRRSPTLRHPTEPWCFGSPDRIVVIDGADACGLEIKTRGWRGARGWVQTTEAEDGVPLDVLVQCHVYMAITGLPRWDVAALLGGVHNYRVYRVPRDVAAERVILDEGRRFWHEHVLARRPPPPDGSPAWDRFVSTSALRVVTPRWVSVEEPGFTQLVEPYFWTRRNLDEAAKRKRQIEQVLVDQFGERIEGEWGSLRYRKSTRGDGWWLDPRWSDEFFEGRARAVLRAFQAGQMPTAIASAKGHGR